MNPAGSQDHSTELSRLQALLLEARATEALTPDAFEQAMLQIVNECESRAGNLFQQSQNFHEQARAAASKANAFRAVQSIAGDMIHGLLIARKKQMVADAAERAATEAANDAKEQELRRQKAEAAEDADAFITAAVEAPEPVHRRNGKTQKASP